MKARKPTTTGPAMKARKPTTTGPGDDEVRLLLDRYKCPIPFHEVRTRFLGNIASPVMSPCAIVFWLC